MSRFATVEDFRRVARRRLPRLVFDYIDGGAGDDEGAVRRNASALRAVELQPRVLRDVGSRCTAVSFLGGEYAVPFGIAPMGLCNLAGPGTDRALARTARDMGFPVTASSMASSTLEDIQRHAGGRAWFQLYVGGSAEEALALAERARAADYRVLALTLDVPQVALRPRDVRNGFAVDFRIGPRQFIDFATHPRWSLATLTAGRPVLANYPQGFDRNASRAAADLNFLKRLRDAWPHKLLVKGVTAVEDAEAVRDAGADAIWVSNHGGRQLGAAPASVDALRRIRGALGEAVPLILDSGVRSGEDVLRALALGADFVMLGRPWLYAAAAAGPEGPAALARMLRDDLSVAMAQVGARGICDLGRSVVIR